MAFLDRRGLLQGAAALFGAELTAPLARALAAEAAPGFAASRTALSTAQLALVSAISERIVPTTDTPGAIAAGVPGFIEMMLADSYEPTDRNEFMQGLGIVEGFRGDVLVWLRLDEAGNIRRCHPRDPSWFQWPLLETAIEGNIVADFPLCNKSFNCSYAGCDL